METLKEVGHALRPILWCSAVPCGRVTREAFETIAGMVMAGIREPDGVYLDLHGAMVAEHLDDPELELIRRLRSRLGSRVPIVASFDLHANLSAERVAACWTGWRYSGPIRISTWRKPARGPPGFWSGAWRANGFRSRSASRRS